MPESKGIITRSALENGIITKSMNKASRKLIIEKIKLPYNIKMLGLVVFTFR